MLLQSPQKSTVSNKIKLGDDKTAAEAQTPFLAISQKKAINRQLCYIFSNADVVVMFTYVAIVVVAVGAMLIPLFVENTRMHSISKNGIFGDDLRTSTRLMIMQSISIGCTLPTISDIFLDQFTYDGNKTKMTRDTWHRLIFLSVLSISGVLYLSLSDCYFMAYLYIILIRIRTLIVGAVTLYLLSYGTVTNSVRSKFILLIPVLVCAVRFVLEAYSLVYPEKVILSSVSSVFEYLVYASILGVQIPWFYLVYCRYRSNHDLNNDEKKETVFMLAMLFYLAACQLVKVITGWPKSWSETGANALVGYIAIQIICILLATVIPTRFMRKVVQVRAQAYACHVLCFIQ